MLGEKFVFGLFVTLICMSIVFLVLIGLNMLIRFQRSIIEMIEGGKKKDEVSKKEEPKIVVQAPKPQIAVQTVEQDDEELVAVISAAIASVLGRPTSNIVVRSIKRVDAIAPAWNAAGRQEQINNRF